MSERPQFAEITEQIRLQSVGHLAVIAVAPPSGSGMMSSMTPKRFSRAPSAQGLGGERLGRLGGLLPQDAGTAFRTDDRIVGVFQHADAVADADAQGAAGPPFPDDHADDRRLQPRHLQQVRGDELGLAAFLGADAGKAPGVSIRQMIGKRNLAASRMFLSALR